MMKHFPFLAAIGSLVFLSSCELLQKTSSTDNSEEDMVFVDLEEVEVVPENDLYRSSAERKWDICHTRLDVSFDWENQWLNGEAQLTLRPYFYDQDSLILDAKGLEIHKITGKHKHYIESEGLREAVEVIHEITNFTNDGMKLRINLEESFTAQDSLLLTIQYTSKPNELEVNGSAAIADAKGLYFINPDGTEDKPQQVWTQGETESNSAWFPTIDKPNERTSQEIFITVEDRFKTLSNGELVYSNFNADGTRTDYWRQELGHTPYLFMMAIGEFKVAVDTWTRPNGEKMLVDYYMEPEYLDYAFDIFGNTPEMLTFYSNLLDYPYPWDKYSQVIVRDYVSGAMENTSAVIHGEFFNQTKEEMLDGDNESTIAHELFHHWFGDLITCESWSNLPLNESFATYGEYLWIEYKYGKDEALLHHYQSRRGYLQEATYSKKNLIRYTYEDKEDMFDSHSYAKGGQILHMLRETVGDEAFFASLAFYLDENEYRAAEIHDLRLAFEEVTGRDLQWFFNQWFLGKGHPVIDITYPSDSLLGSTIVFTQTQDFATEGTFILPVNIEIFYTDGTNEKRKLTIDQRIEVLSVPEGKAVGALDFDTSDYLLAEVNNQLPTEGWFKMWEVADNYIEKSRALRKTVKLDLPQKNDAILAAMNDDFWRIKEEALTLIDSTMIGNADMAQKAAFLLKNDPKSDVRGAAAATLALIEKGDKTEMLLTEALNDPSLYARYEALLGLHAVNPAVGLAKAKALEPKAYGEPLFAIAEIYMDEGDASYQGFFDRAIKNGKGFDNWEMMSIYSEYVQSQDSKGLLAAAETASDMIGDSEVWWLRYAAYQALMDWEDYLEEIKPTTAEGEEPTDRNWLAAKERINNILDEALETETNERMRGFLMSRQ